MLQSPYPALALSVMDSFCPSLPMFLFFLTHCLSPTVHCSLSLSLLLPLSLSDDIWQPCVCTNVCSCDWTASGGRLHQQEPVTYGNIFSLDRAFTALRMFSGFPFFSLKEIPQHLTFPSSYFFPPLRWKREH